MDPSPTAPRSGRRPPMRPGRPSPQRAEAVSLHLDGLSTIDIAARLGVARQTVSRWLNDPAASQTIDAELRERRARDERRHAHMRGLAIDAMIAVLADPSHRDRWRAARAVLELAARAPQSAKADGAPAACGKCAEAVARAAMGRAGLIAWLTRLPSSDNP